MDAAVEKHAQAFASHQSYLNSLKRPTLDEARRISDIQLQKEAEIDSKYHTHSAQEHDAATKIQAAYRGHRQRREQLGLVLDPSSRWMDLIAEMRYRSVVAPHRDRASSDGNKHKRAASSSDIAKMHWRRAGWIAEHAGRGENPTTSGRTPSDVSSGSSTPADANQSEPSSMLMDLRYFLEMVDAKHRYGANLQVYHEFWQRQNTTDNFFHWLDHGPGRHLDLPLCSREKLDREKIRYLSREERKDYLVRVDDQGRLRWDKNGELITTRVDEYKDSNHGIVPKSSPEPLSPAVANIGSPEARHALAHDLAAFSHLSLDSQVSSSSSSSSNSSSPETPHPTSPSSTPQKEPHRSLRVSPAALLNHLLRYSVKPGTWIYVTDTLNRLYVGIKNSGAFQHASFLSGARIRSAGAIGIQDGRLTYLSPLSGHYRPTTRSFRAFVDGLEESGVDLAALRVSGAYKVLRGMELYGRTKRGLRKARGMREKRSEKGEGRLGKEERVALEALHETEGVSATELVERHWEEHHGRRGKGKA